MYTDLIAASDKEELSDQVCQIADVTVSFKSDVWK